MTTLLILVVGLVVGYFVGLNFPPVTFKKWFENIKKQFSKK